jgi:mono/diheme cytochrome c family protein
LRLILAAVAFLSLAACDSGTEERLPVTSTRGVAISDAPAPSGAVPRGASATAAALAPPGPAVTPALIDRGRERFLAFCSPCHGAEGHGDGPVVTRGFPAPPSYHQKRLREAGAEHFVAVITTGIGRMYAYGDRIPPQDRWAIAHYVKSLQAAEAESPEAEQ